jgi:hypothetical protein
MACIKMYMDVNWIEIPSSYRAKWWAFIMVMNLWAS